MGDVEPLPASAYRVPLPKAPRCTCLGRELMGVKAAHAKHCPSYEKPTVRTMRRRKGMGSKGMG